MAPGSDGIPPAATGGGRRPDGEAPARLGQPAREPRTDADADLRRVLIPSSSEPRTGGPTTLPPSGRADRRREGLLPSGEDPMIRRPPARPAGGPPPGAGRRRTDLDPTAAPGRPPETGERRRPLEQPALQDRPAAPAVPQPASGPMTSVASPAIAGAGRPAPPSPRRDDAAATSPGATAAGATAWDVARPDAAPRTTGMPSWAAEPGPPTPPPYDVTQRVSGQAPAESPWGSGPATPVAGRAAPTPASAVASPSPAAPAARPARPAQPPARPPAPAVPPAGRGAPAAQDLPEPDVAGPAAEPVRRRADVPVGGRAAARLERQAAETARKKSGRRSGPPTGPAIPAQSGPGRGSEPDDAPRRSSSRVVQGLVATVVVAVGVLGFWSFTSPGTTETAAQTPVTGSAPATSAASLPSQETAAPSAEVVASPVGPVFAPITVLNSTSINGLAGDIGDAFSAAGWEVTGTGKSPVEDVATTTVYYTEGDTVQQQAAAQLTEQFPDVTGPVARYFDVPGETAPGLVVVVTGNWQP
ncbi:LytR C-terminal domain-containing protein [Modestobacter altitudinis]|uniref:LytR C-terminal domain-containing protein n=1 Tax=Modestobacter altitudinis TaxID=2213158 RepID=UPI00110CE17A|nr:LytR C-terminal domain-containing protein [Modestobacter altitudinis]